VRGGDHPPPGLAGCMQYFEFHVTAETQRSNIFFLGVVNISL
jgi:hypothetical protein